MDRLGDVLCGDENRPAMPASGVAQRVTEIAQQVPAVGDLDSARSAATGTISVGTGPIAGDDLDTGIALEPCLDAAGMAIRQQVDNLVTLEIADDRSIALTAAPRPVVYTDDPGRRDRL